MNKIGFFIVCALCGCADKVKEVFGIDHYQPNEFLIFTNAPLTYPTHFDLPKPGQNTSLKKNQSGLLPVHSQGDIEFLKELKCEKENPQIREILKEDQKNFLKKLSDQIKKNFATIKGS
jgi:hypothetical protein